MKLLRFYPLLLLAVACTNKDGAETGDIDDTSVAVDEDGDGVPSDQDCDDNDAAVYPGAAEVCDNVDNNCDGAVDEGVTTTWYPDGDGDGYGVDAGATEACEAPEGHVGVGGDCDDDDAAYHPGAPEDDCADPNDYNCDGSVGYADNDDDGWPACEECDDTNPDIRPDATEVCDDVDNDCDGLVDDEDDSLDASTGGTFYADIDADGYGDASAAIQACDQPASYVTDSTDCDDAVSTINPGAAEVCDDLDDDCDGLVDDEDDSLDASTGSDWYADSDGDGYGDADNATQACDQPSGYIADSSDCDDASGAVHPGATERCNGVDDDCDGTTDPDSAADAPDWYADDDGDGYGDASDVTAACAQPSGTVSDSSDCDDDDGAVHPGATEVCNSVDDDCDGLTDDDDGGLDAATASTWYADDDGDSYGDPDDSEVACDQPSGAVSDSSDCDDDDSAIHPGATEECDDVDNDCDGTVDGVVLVDEDFNSTLGADWVLNGTAVQDTTGGYLSLTEVSGGTGTAWYADPLPADDFYVSFMFSTGGGTGADGLGFGWLDPSAASTASIGSGGGGMGLLNLQGYSIEADTYYNSGYDNNGNHLAVMGLNGFTNYGDATGIPTLENGGWFLLEAWVSGGVVDVDLDGTNYISGVAISGYALTEAIMGFGGATGGSTNYHYVDDVYIECPED
ncbi:MAG: hypothetical protein H6739_23890 [Alphaproteobacteria bacterium]|nr:hypothetical protein [Alphaproteobacteria bacterium]